MDVLAGCDVEYGFIPNSIGNHGFMLRLQGGYQYWRQGCSVVIHMRNVDGEKVMDFYQFNLGVGSTGHFFPNCLSLKKGTGMTHRTSVSSDWINGKAIDKDGKSKVRFQGGGGRELHPIWWLNSLILRCLWDPSGMEGLNSLFKVINMSNHVIST